MWHQHRRSLPIMYPHVPVFALLVLLLFTLFPVAPVAAADKVVGSGTAASCTSTALVNAVTAAQNEGGGAISFNCGPNAVTITLAATLDITAPAISIDGGGKVTLSGGNARRIITHRTWGNIGSSVLTLQNLTLSGGHSSGAESAVNGAAIQSFFQAAKPEFKPTLNVTNVTFTNNDATVTGFDAGKGLNAYDFGGGAIYSQGGTVNVKNSTFADNDANNGAGGAIHILQSALSIENSTFTNNTAIGSEPGNSQGGAIYIDGVGGANGAARITGSTFSNNRSYNSGGAIYVNMYENSNQFTVEQSSFVNNALTGGNGALGGAISGGSSANGANSGNASVSISSSLFAGNSAKKTRDSEGKEDGSGGALAFAQRARISISNSTFYDNKAFGSSFNANGGALYVVNNSDQFQVTNSTFANNFAGWVGGAISNSQINGQPGGVVRNTIFANNSADNGPNDWNIQQHCSSELDGSNNLQFPGRLTGGNFWNDVTCFKGKSAPEQKNLPDFRDPQLAALADNGGPTQTMAIAADSPAFNGGANCAASDQRGIARPQGSACDIGAFELVLKLNIDPAFAGVGEQDVTLTVTGTGFSQSSKVLVNGQERPTSFVNSSTLRATLSAADLERAGELQISVSASTLPAVVFNVLASVEKVFVPITRK